MSKRKKMKVNGELLPMMAGGYIRRTYYPPEPRKVNFPKPPDGLRGKALKKWMGETAGKVEAVAAAEWKRWPKERVPDTQIRIEFMAWAWEGRLLGEHVKSIDGGELNKLCQLVLPDGTVIEGRTVDLPNEQIQTNAAILREERESIDKLETKITKAVRYGNKLSKNDANKGGKKVGAQRKVIPQQMRTALRKVDTLLDGGEATSAAAACKTVHEEMKLPITVARFQNIYSNPKEKAAVGYKKTSKSPKASRK